MRVYDYYLSLLFAEIAVILLAQAYRTTWQWHCQNNAPLPGLRRRMKGWNRVFNLSTQAFVATLLFGLVYSFVRWVRFY